MVSEAGRKNERFQRDNAERVQNCFRQVLGLTSDSMDHLSIFTSSTDLGNAFVRQAMAFFVPFVMMPASYSVYLNLMAGNLSACFRELRFITESLVKCYLADSKYRSLDFYQEKLGRLEKEEKETTGKRRVKREHDFTEEIDDKFNSDGRYTKLWGRLSEEEHLRGFAKRVIDKIMRDSTPAMVFPWEYDDGDIDDLKELSKYVAELRELTSVAMQRYAQDHGLLIEKMNCGDSPLG